MSSFYAEILRLRQILDLTAGPLPVLFLIDEFLHGTTRTTGASARRGVGTGPGGSRGRYRIDHHTRPRAGRHRASARRTGRQRALRGSNRERPDPLRLRAAPGRGAEEQRNRADAVGGSGDLKVGVLDKGVSVGFLARNPALSATTVKFPGPGGPCLPQAVSATTVSCLGADDVKHTASKPLAPSAQTVPSAGQYSLLGRKYATDRPYGHPNLRNNLNKHVGCVIAVQ